MKPKTVLVLANHMPRDANVISDYLLAFPRYSRHRFRFLACPEQLPPECDLSSFDAILLFWSYYWVEADLPAVVMEKIRRSRALKVLMLQDEYRRVQQSNRIMNRLGVNVMLTNVPPQNHQLYYPSENIPSLLHVETVLTGYVPDYLHRDLPSGWNQRPITIGYRSRHVPFALGDLGQEKTWIADRFRAICDKEGLTYDISVREEDRIYGQVWLDFLSRCRFSLGTESGASVTDFDGRIDRGCAEYVARHPNATYEEVKRAVFPDMDWQCTLATISPRVFEAAALGSVLILHEGDYLGVLRPDQHYILVRKDYSNIPEVLARIRDEPYCLTLQQNAYRDLIASRAFSYQGVIQRFDTVLDRLTPPASEAEKICGATKFYLDNYFKHTRALIPYRGRAWIEFSWTPLFLALWLLKELVLQPALLVLLLMTFIQGARNMGRMLLHYCLPRLFPRVVPPELSTISPRKNLAATGLIEAVSRDDSPTAQSNSFRCRCKSFLKTLLILAWLRHIRRGQAHYGEPIHVRLLAEAGTQHAILKTEPISLVEPSDSLDHWSRFNAWLASGQRIRWFLDNSSFHYFLPLRMVGLYVPLRLGKKQIELSKTIRGVFAHHPWCARWLLQSILAVTPAPVGNAAFRQPGSQRVA